MFQKKFNLLFLLTIFIFLVIKIPQIDFRYGDENIYFYMGQLITHGFLPYQDFFFASPPFEILFNAFLILIFGFNIFVLKIVPLISVVGVAVILYVLLRYWKKTFAGLMAVIFYLFSFLILTTSDYSSGVQLTVFLFLLTIYFLEKDKPLLAALISVLTMLTRLYALPILLAVFIYYFVTKRRSSKIFASLATILFLIVNLFLWLVFKNNYLSDVYLYHFLKFEELDRSLVWNFFLRWDFVLIVFGILAIFIVKFRKIYLSVFCLISGVIFLLFFKDIYYLYFNLILPFLVLLATLAVLELAKTFSYTNSGAVISFILIVVLLAGVSGYNVYFYFKDHAKTARIEYLKNFNQFILENSESDDKIYGSFEITPLVAGMTGRSIAGNFVDTNNKTFSTGLFKLSDREKILIAEKVKFIITKTLVDQKGNLLEFGNFISLDFLTKNCLVVKKYPIYKDYSSNLTLLWQCFFD